VASCAIWMSDLGFTCCDAGIGHFLSLRNNLTLRSRA
jgi:hypothetical protein